MHWLSELLTGQSIAQAVIVYGLIIALGTWLGKIKLFGISLGVTWVLFMGLLASHFGVNVNPEIETFLKEFGLILFVYCIGLQVSPGFFSSLKKTAYTSNALAAMVVLLGVLTTIILMFVFSKPASVMTGVMSGAVTNTPGLAAAQAAVKDLHLDNSNNTFLTLAYALAYPFGVFGIICTIIFLKIIFRINLNDERALHQKINEEQANTPISFHLQLENKQLIGQPLRKVFEIVKVPIVVSRMYHNGEIITPSPDLVLQEGDILLIVANKELFDNLKLIIGSESQMNLKTAPHSELISRMVVVTRSEVTHRRLGDIPELHQHNFTLTRLGRAGVEMVPHGDIILQLGDTIKVVGTPEGVKLVTERLGNSIKRLEVPDLAPIFIGIVLGVLVGSIPFYFPNVPIPIKIGLAGGPLIVALMLGRFGNLLYLNNYTTNSANLMVRELGITLFLASVGLSSGHKIGEAFASGDAWLWIGFGLCITFIPLLTVGMVARFFFKKTYFEICGLLAGASTDPPALAFALQSAKSDVPSVTYATVYPLTMILRIIAGQLLILFFAS